MWLFVFVVIGIAVVSVRCCVYLCLLLVFVGCGGVLMLLFVFVVIAGGAVVADVCSLLLMSLLFVVSWW